MKNLILLVLLFLMSSCTNFHELSIKNVVEEQHFDLKANSEKPTQCTFIIKGEIVGEAQLLVNWHSPDGHYSRVYNIVSKIDTTIRADWYQNTMNVIYKPLSAVSGELLIKYSID